MSLTPWAIFGIVTLLAYVTYREIFGSNPRRLPPGPEAIPLLGNLGDFPPNGALEYQHWLRHKKLYGGISSVSVMGMTLVLIHDKQAAKDLLEQQSSKTSGRPTMVMANKLCGYENIIVCQDYNPTFKRSRKLLHRVLGTSASAAEFRGIQEVGVHKQLVKALNQPDKWLDHFKTNAASTVLKMAYGYTVTPDKPDTLVGIIDKMMTEFSLAAVPMAWAVDIIPALQHLPENFPGAGFKKTARKWKKSIQACAYIPYRFVQRQMAAETHEPSYVSKLVEELKAENDGVLDAEDERAIIWTAASLYGAAADTGVIALTSWTLAMLRFPDVQRKAQEEIDRVVGRERLPTLDDRENLPYVNALVQETLRWWPIAPMGFPHTATEDILYRGYMIPKGSLLLPAVWWFLHDPEVYSDSESFDPDRFLAPRNEPDPSSDAFGYGRRICAGRYFADESLYLHIVQSLAVFTIKKAVGPDGEEIEVDDVKPKPGVLTYPTDFTCRVVPRSEAHERLIRGLEARYATDTAKEKGDADLLDSVEDFELVE
ncbi:cytochrome P450 [Aspergillus pseudoustus]|uniref:Cytochrome P450 n=1 Tax=Aspergillus pseudoustus TaxID=1810923 RepID=A0ABR4JZ16_9EURO